MTIRYALPLLPVIAYAAMAAVEGLPARALPVAAIGIAAIALMQALPASVHYAREGAPVFRAFDDMAATAHGGDRVDTIALHASARRAAEWATPILPARVAAGAARLRVADAGRRVEGEPVGARLVRRGSRPDRSRLCSIRARAISRAPIAGDSSSRPFVGGARPDDVDWYRMQPPNWMLDRGWSVTAEIAGVTARDKQGPPLAPAIAWLRRQPQEDDGRARRPASRRRRRAGHRQAERLAGRDVPGAARLLLPAAHAARRRAERGSAAYVPLEVTSVGQVTLEQFDAQPPGVSDARPTAPGGSSPSSTSRSAVPGDGRARRRSCGCVRSDATSPAARRRVPAALLRRRAARPRADRRSRDRRVRSVDPTSIRPITLPADLLAAANGRVVLESSKFFVPAAAGAADQRHLALRIYRVRC